MKEFTFIETQKQLKEMCDELSEEDCIAVDLECENNLHYYGSYISLIQISSKKDNWIVDVLTLKEIAPLIEVLTNHKIQKVFHDIGFDFRILNSQFNCRPQHIFDTQVAAIFLGMTELGLGALLEKFFDIYKEKKFQMADWTKRPLTEDMLSYAIGDTVQLLALKKLLESKLKEKDRLPWVEEEMREIEKKDLTYQEGTFMGAKGFKSLTPTQRSIFKNLFLVRDELAKKVNRPVHYIISTKRLLEISCKRKMDKSFWENIKQVHPIVRKQAYKFFAAFNKGLKEKIEIETNLRKYFNEKQKRKIRKINDLRDKLSEELQLPKHLILSREQILRIVIDDSYEGLKMWQRKLIL